MKRKIFAVAITICLLGVGAWYLNQDQGDGQLDSNPESVWYTTTDIVEAIEQTGVVLEADSDLNPDDYQLGGVKPTVYTINKPIDHLWVYVFDDIKDRDAVVVNGVIPYSNEPIIQKLQTRNVMILQTGMAEKNGVYQAINVNLNNIQTAVFGATSEDWDARFTLEYYDNEIVDQNGITYQDRYAKDLCEVRFIGEDPNDQVEVEMEINGPTGNYSYQGIPIDTDGDSYRNLGSSWGFHFFGDLDQPITWDFSWNNNQETLVLSRMDT